MLDMDCTDLDTTVKFYQLCAVYLWLEIANFENITMDNLITNAGLPPLGDVYYISADREKEFHAQLMQFINQGKTTQ